MAAQLTINHLIDGQERPSLDGGTFTSVEPRSGRPLATVALGGEQDVDLAVRAAWAAHDDGRWRRLNPGERARRLRRLATLIADRSEDLAQLEARDNGAPITKTRGDIASAVALVEYFAQLPDHVSGSTYASAADHLVYSRREPYGVVGAIAPWNFPFLLACWKTVPAIAVGNSVVLKMAEQTPATTDVFGRLCLEAGIPPGVVNIVHGDGALTGAALVAHPRVPKITFTGSSEVGKAILRVAADHVKSVHLELGGKSPNIVFPDADLSQALRGSLFSTYFNSGQVCSAGTRVMVHRDVLDEFRSEFVRGAEGLRVGDPMDEATQLGPLVSKVQQERVLGYIRLGEEEGASVLTGGPSATDPSAEGYYVAPTVFDGVRPDMRIAQEEIFGPVASLIPFGDEDEAVRIANDVVYGLTARVWTSDLSRALRLAERLDVGTVQTNGPTTPAWNVPYEGHKMSGLGEDKGLEVIQTFTILKVHSINFGGGTSGF